MVKKQCSAFNILNIQEITAHQTLAFKGLRPQHQPLSSTLIPEYCNGNVCINPCSHCGSYVLQAFEVGGIDWPKLKNDVIFYKAL
jgi:hypothetical protein